MTTLQILMPMGGLGTRFQEAGFDTPKPLIKVDGKAMVLKALESFANLDCQKKFIFVIRREHVEKYQLDQKLLEQVPSAEIVILTSDTQGAVETCLAAKDRIGKENPLVVMDCDLYFESKEYLALLQQTLKNQDPKLGGGLLYFDSDLPRYSYAEIRNGLVTRTAEKVVISNNALAGAYFFASGKIFLDAAETLMKHQISTTMKEYYLSLLYNIILEKGYSVKAAQIDSYYSFGTPEELKNYEEVTSKN
ncbi:MAG: glycosyltransferase family 2 protein [Candidatus Gracilibacteria bacterium]|nr:glycosyltransferase family 2 protein [Candidatus Gracilibacteria bacterium]